MSWLGDWVGENWPTGVHQTTIKESRTAQLCRSTRHGDGRDVTRHTLGVWNLFLLPTVAGHHTRNLCVGAEPLRVETLGGTDIVKTRGRNLDQTAHMYSAKTVCFWLFGTYPPTRVPWRRHSLGLSARILEMTGQSHYGAGRLLRGRCLV